MGHFTQLIWLVIIAAYIFRDRILAFGLMQWLSKVTGFAWSLDWLSLQLGTQNVDLVLSGFRWANPPGFEWTTPYFIEVRRVTLRVEPMSVYRALRDDGEIHCRCFEVEGVKLYIEKHKHGHLNMWKALGFDDEQAAAVTKEVQDARAAPPPTASASADAAGAGADARDDDADDDDDDDAPHVPHKGRDERRAARQARKKAKKAKKAEERAAAAADAAAPDTHWGVPCELDVERCTFRGVKVHAADFLRSSKASKNAKSDDARMAIQVKYLELPNNKLRVKDANDGTLRSPFLNELVMQRIVPAIINAVVSSNTTVILHTAISAGLDNAAASANAAYKSTATAAQQQLLNIDHGVGELAKGLGIEKKRDTSATATAATVAAGVKELRVRLLRGRELSRNGNRVTPFCVLRVSADGATGQAKPVKAQSRTCATTRKPEWDEEFRLDVASLDSSFDLTLMDKNTMPFGKDSRMGELRVPLKELSKDEPHVAWYELKDLQGKADGKCAGEIELSLQLA